MAAISSNNTMLIIQSHPIKVISVGSNFKDHFNSQMMHMKHCNYFTQRLADCLLTGKPPRCYTTNHLGQLSLLSLQSRKIEYRPVWLGYGRVCSLGSGGR